MFVIKIVCTHDRDMDTVAVHELKSAEFHANKARYDAKNAVLGKAVLEQFHLLSVSYSACESLPLGH